MRRESLVFIFLLAVGAHAADISPAWRNEKLNRGVLALRQDKAIVYVGWRLLETDPPATTFHVYRRSPGQEMTRLTLSPVSTTTDYVDTHAPATACEYFVRAVTKAGESDLSAGAAVAPGEKAEAYHAIKLEGDYTFQKCALADLDGDGALDFVIKQPNENVDPYIQYWKKSPTTYKLEAYRSDGKLLWKHDLGWSIESGIWYSPYIVYDLNGDGKAEVAVKTGEGDPRDPDGRVTKGAEYATILEGATGKVITQVPWPSREGFKEYNRFARNQLAVAFLDGRRPSLLVERGTYDTIKLDAYVLEEDTLRSQWHWTDAAEPAGLYRGQGAHCLRAADIDNDGHDEIVLGSAVVDENGKGLWATRLGHPDHVYIGDLDPLRPGLEIYFGIETKQPKNGMCMVDAATGKVLWGFDKPTRHVHGQGMCSDIDAQYPGVECYSADTDAEKKFAFALLHDAKGNVIGTENLGGFAPHAVYWDADTQRELIQKRRIVRFKGKEAGRLEGNPVAIADIAGDWREEIITCVPGELRIYSTTIPARDRRVCLLRDPIYRSDVTGFSQGYFQVPSLRVLPGFEKN